LSGAQKTRRLAFLGRAWEVVPARLEPAARRMAVEINYRRRWFGLLYLIGSGGLLIWGLTWLRPVLRGWLFVGYWLACLLLVLLALGAAWCDWRDVRRQLRAERRRLLARSLEEIREAAATKPPPPRPSAPLPPPPHA
jgi:hypothetical protein